MGAKKDYKEGNPVNLLQLNPQKISPSPIQSNPSLTIHPRTQIKKSKIIKIENNL